MPKRVSGKQQIQKKKIVRKRKKMETTCAQDKKMKSLENAHAFGSST